MSNEHYHNAYELYFLEEGYHQMLTNDFFYDVTMHDVALFKPNSFHRSYRNQACARTCLYLKFAPLQQKNPRSARIPLKIHMVK